MGYSFQYIYLKVCGSWHCRYGCHMPVTMLQCRDIGCFMCKARSRNGSSTVPCSGSREVARHTELPLCSLSFCNTTAPLCLHKIKCEVNVIGIQCLKWTESTLCSFLMVLLQAPSLNKWNGSVIATNQMLAPCRQKGKLCWPVNS